MLEKKSNLLNSETLNSPKSMAASLVVLYSSMLNKDTDKIKKIRQEKLHSK